MIVHRPRLALSSLFLVSVIIFGTLIFSGQLATLQTEPRNSVTDRIVAQDTLRPEIYGWGIDGIVSDGEAFTVWGNVTDTESGVHNVTAKIRQDGGDPVVTLMVFNSSFYTATFPGVELNHTYLIWVEAYDTEDNLALSYSRSFDLRIDLNPQVDPTLTLPYVVSFSLLALAIAIGLSFVYNKRNPRLETGVEEETNSDDSSQNE